MARLRILLALGLWLGVSGCSGMDRRVAYRPYRPTAHSRFSANAPRAQAAPFTNRMPSGLSGFFPGLDRSRDASAPSTLLASRSAPEAPRPTVVRELPATPVNLARSFREPPPSVLPVAVRAEVYPEPPGPRAAEVARRAIPRDEATHLAQAETRDDPVRRSRDARVNDAPASAEFPEGRAPVDDLVEPPSPTILADPEIAASEANPTERGDDQAEFDPSPDDLEEPAADSEMMPPIAEVEAEAEIDAGDGLNDPDDAIEAPPPPRPAQPKPAIVLDPDTNGDPNLAGRPRMPLIRPIGLPSDLPPPSFPRTYYGSQPRPEPRIQRISMPKTPPPPPQPRRSWSARLIQRWRGFHEQPPSTRWRAGDFPDSRSFATSP